MRMTVGVHLAVTCSCAYVVHAVNCAMMKQVSPSVIKKSIEKKHLRDRDRDRDQSPAAYSRQPTTAVAWPEHMQHVRKSVGAFRRVYARAGKRNAPLCVLCVLSLTHMHAIAHAQKEDAG